MASAQAIPPTSNPPNSTIARREPVFRRISYFVQLWGLQKLTTVGVGLLRLFKPLPRHERPTLVKTYPVRPKLNNRVFIPQSHKAGDILPLYIDIHGGGMALCHPYFDDEFCAHFCNKYNILVIALDYSKAPQVTFPVPTDDIEALVDAVLLDESLPIDKTRVVIGGFSAGGNLSLSAAQAPALQGRIHGLVPWYPVIEWVTNTSQKLKTRPYRNKKDVDLLTSLGPMFNWGYINPGQDLTDPRLSVSYADKNTLPRWIFMLGVEYDMLCNEAKEMIMDLAELKGAEREEGLYEFERGTYRWRMVRDVIHGYNQIMGPSDEGDAVRLQRVEETYAEVGEWLFKGPFAKETS